jgi:hypothetical protein
LLSHDQSPGVSVTAAVVVSPLMVMALVSSAAATRSPVATTAAATTALLLLLHDGDGDVVTHRGLAQRQRLQHLTPAHVSSCNNNWQSIIISFSCIFIYTSIIILHYHHHHHNLHQ